MARLQTPLLSFRAAGQIAKAVVTYTWRGIHCMRQYVIPRDPKTPLQLAQRNKIRQGVHAWRYYISYPPTLEAWREYDRQVEGPLTGYNHFLSAACIIQTTDPAAAFVRTWSTSPTQNLDIELIALDDGSLATETGLFTVMLGQTPDVLSRHQNLSINPPGHLLPLDFGNPGEVWYFQVVKDVLRSGIGIIQLA